MAASLENRMRFPLEVFDAVRAVFPAERPVTMRVSGTDWAEGGWTIEETVAFAQGARSPRMRRDPRLERRAHSGAEDPGRAELPGAARPRRQAAIEMPVIAVGLITEFEQAEAIIGTGDADLIALARAILYDPRWPWHAAAHFGAAVKAPNQYLRSQPRPHPNLFTVRADN